MYPELSQSANRASHERLLIVHRQFSAHGAHAGLTPLANLLPGRIVEGHERSLWRFLWRRPLYRWLRPLLDGQRTLYTHQSIRREQSVLAHMLRRRGGLVHFLWGDFDYRHTGRWASRLGWKTLATFHGARSQLPGTLPDLESIRRLDGVVCVAHDQRAFFETLLPPEKVHVVPIGIETAYFVPAADPAAFRPRVLMVGFTLRDFETTARVCATLRNRMPNVELVMVIPEKARRTTPAIDGVRLEVGIPDDALRGLYQESAVLLHALTDCSASQSILEALACGLPVVVTDVGGVRDYIDDSCVLAHPPGDDAGMVDTVRRLIEDRALNLRMRLAARRQAETFTWTRIAARYVTLYRSLGAEWIH